MNERLDIAMVQRGLAPNRSKAQALILAGDVIVDGHPARKAGETVGMSSEILLVQPPKFVSRGGDKLDHALSVFGIALENKVCADFGASTGGFTDAILQRGAAKVFAIDVGYGQIAMSLRNDSRVVVMDRVNARYLEALADPIDFTSIDASFISLSKLFPAVVRISGTPSELVALIKPQFEAGKGEVGKNGVVRSCETHRRILTQVIEQAQEQGLQLAGLTASPIKGPAGNIEFLGYFLIHDETPKTIDCELAIDRALESSPT